MTSHSACYAVIRIASMQVTWEAREHIATIWKSKVIPDLANRQKIASATRKERWSKLYTNYILRRGKCLDCTGCLLCQEDDDFDEIEEDEDFEYESARDDALCDC